jgi:hypothetical protein
MCRINHKKLKAVRFLCLGITLLLSSQNLFSQVIEAGLKGGLLTSWVRYDEADYRKIVKTNPVLGYSAGAVVSFKVTDKYFLHTEYLFSTKGRKNKGRIDKALEDRATYNFIEIPVLYNVFFKGRLQFGGQKQFKYYAGGGPLFSYWLSGRGKIYNDYFDEENIPELKYKIKFGKRSEDENDSRYVHIAEPRRLQLGFVVGGGILTEPDAKRRIMVDLRFEYGHSWLAKSEAEDFIIPTDYNPSLKARNMSLRLSGIYLMELNTNKKARNKGKSTLKRKLKR